MLGSLQISFPKPNKFQSVLMKMLASLGYPGECNLYAAERFTKILNKQYGIRNYTRREFAAAMRILINEENNDFVNFKNSVEEDDDAVEYLTAIEHCRAELEALGWIKSREEEEEEELEKELL